MYIFTYPSPHIPFVPCLQSVPLNVQCMRTCMPGFLILTGGQKKVSAAKMTKQVEPL